MDMLWCVHVTLLQAAHAPSLLLGEIQGSSFYHSIPTWHRAWLLEGLAVSHSICQPICSGRVGALHVCCIKQCPLSWIWAFSGEALALWNEAPQDPDGPYSAGVSRESEDLVLLPGIWKTWSIQIIFFVFNLLVCHLYLFCFVLF